MAAAEGTWGHDADSSSKIVERSDPAPGSSLSPLERWVFLPVAAGVGIATCLIVIHNTPSQPEFPGVNVLAGGFAGCFAFGIAFCSEVLLARPFTHPWSYGGGRRPGQKRSLAMDDAHALVAKGDFEQAAGMLEAQLKSRPNLEDYKDLGQCYLNLHQPKRALDAYEKALAMDPEEANLQTIVKGLKQELAKPAL
jgi:hypothetical protein